MQKTIEPSSMWLCFSGQRCQMNESFRRVAGMIAVEESVEADVFGEQSRANDDAGGIGIGQRGAALDGNANPRLVFFDPRVHRHIPSPSRLSERISRTNSRKALGPCR